ncbi:MAG: sigma-70 family RNA polymerase sigma factor [Myxacorys californica WJT36-NPBG1]|jgi:DNA-directed RNA polymerase specialized sigma24 family protein|nr:sigma-70 family RNA polymerase sigma factor [Myxacorys californica WJT36-NPBG1]
MQDSFTVSAIDIDDAKHRFDQFYTDGLSTEGSQGYRNLLGFVKSKLKQFNLDYDPTAILSEAYERGWRLFNSGESVEKPIAWLRATSFNIIREKSRKHQREQPCEFEFIERHLGDSYDDFALKENTDEKYARIAIAFRQLDSSDQKILTLRILQDLTWKEVVQDFEAEGENLSETTARQRGKRALNRLKRLYEQ